jgi:adenosylcobalamin-dependent ribonucleoside-triphosphate reductase
LEVVKRDGKTVAFDKYKIIKAVENAMRETLKGVDTKISNYIAEQVEEILQGHENITVEDIQDLIEILLMETPRKDVAKRYILYRNERAKTRFLKKDAKYELLDNEFISQYKHAPAPMDQLGTFTYYRTYSRWLSEEGKREEWWQTVRRAVEYNCTLTRTSKKEAQQLYKNIFNLKQFLSGRSFWIGGTDVSNKYPLANFNCAFIVIDSIIAFRDLFYLLMLGTGVGNRILLHSDINKLPKFKTKMNLIHQDYIPYPKDKRTDYTSVKFIGNDTAEIIIGDSKEGWCNSLYYYIDILTNKMYRNINKVIMNYNHVRPKGEKLKTFGGSASGHESIKIMFYKIDKIVSKEIEINYMKLRPIDVIDICNAIGENVVIGGVRRTSQNCLISPFDGESIQAKNELYVKKGQKWIENKELSHRKMSNNSIFYEEKPTREQLQWHMKQLKQSGEPGFVNVKAAKERYGDFEGLNPCYEILLPSKGVCNLVTLNVYGFIKNGKLDLEEMKEAQRLNVRAAYRMSTVELELHEWDIINKKDKLLGVSLTGWQDMASELNMSKKEQENLLLELWETAFSAAEEIAKELDDKQPLLITTCKPEGTLSLLPGVSAGIHYSHSPYYIRRIRISANDPLAKVAEELEYPMFPEVGEEWETCRTKVIEFPVKSPSKKTKYDISAIEQLENYKMFLEYYVDHNASVTISVKEHEWEEVEEWVWNNWEKIVAISFLSLDNSFYDLMPYENITEAEYEERAREMRPFITSLLQKYEQEEIDLDTGSLSDCEGGTCSIR